MQEEKEKCPQNMISVRRVTNVIRWEIRPGIMHILQHLAFADGSFNLGNTRMLIAVVLSLSGHAFSKNVGGSRTRAVSFA